MLALKNRKGDEAVFVIHTKDMKPFAAAMPASEKIMPGNSVANEKRDAGTAALISEAIRNYFPILGSFTHKKEENLHAELMKVVGEIANREGSSAFLTWTSGRTGKTCSFRVLEGEHNEAESAPK